MVIYITFIVSMCIHVFSLSTGANCKFEVTVHFQGGAMLPVALLVHLLGTNTHCCWLNVGALIGKYSKTHGCWILRGGCGIRQAAGFVNCMLWMCAFGVQKSLLALYMYRLLFQKPFSHDVNTLLLHLA